MPDFSAIPAGQVRNWLIAVKILRGEDVTMAYPEGQCINVVLDADITVPREVLGIPTPMIVSIGEEAIDLGLVEVWLTDPTLMERRQHEGRTHYAFTTPGRTVRYHRPAGPLAA